MDNVEWETNSYAKLFKIGTQKGNKVLFILHPKDQTRVLQKFYRGKTINQKNWIKVGAMKSLAMGSCVLARYAELLGQEDRVKAVDNLDFYSSSYFLNKKNQLIEFQKSASIKYELLANAKCDVLFLSGENSNLNSKMLKKMKLPAVLFHNHLESHPLGSAEWVKVMAFFLDITDSTFEKEKKRYLSIEKTNKLKEPKKVLINAPYKGVWYIPKRETPINVLLGDAGARIWPALDGSGTGSLTLEQVYNFSDSVDFWLNPNLCTSRTAILQEEPRMSELKAFRNAKIYNNTKQLLPNGGNNYYEMFNTQPSLILKDLVSIFGEDGGNLDFFEPVE